MYFILCFVDLMLDYFITKMPTVVERNVENKFILNYTICKFLLKNIIKILPRSSLEAFRKVEIILKKISKLKADLKYLY